MTPRSTFGPVVLLGLAASGLAAVAGHHALLEVPDALLKASGPAAFATQDQRGVDVPLAGALALVALACWGVLLVTRGRVRRVVALIATLAAAGVLVAAVFGGFVDVASAEADLGARISPTGQSVPLDRTIWLWLTVLTAAVSLVAGAAAVRFSPQWPEMGSQYDAPTGGSAATPATSPAADPGSLSNLDLWKSLDEGADPTDTGADSGADTGADSGADTGVDSGTDSSSGASAD